MKGFEAATAAAAVEAGRLILVAGIAVEEMESKWREMGRGGRGKFARRDGASFVVDTLRSWWQRVSNLTKSKGIT